MDTLEPTRVVVTDANVLINLIHVDRLSLLGAIDRYDFVVLPEVEAEVSLPEHAKALASAIEAGHLQRLSFSSAAEAEIYAGHVQVIGKGESACLAMAEVQGWHVASDERGKFLQMAKERLGAKRILNTAGIFVLAIRASLLTFEEADEDKRVLEEHRFKMRFHSFREVVKTRPCFVARRPVGRSGVPGCPGGLCSPVTPWRCKEEAPTKEMLRVPLLVGLIRREPLSTSPAC